MFILSIGFLLTCIIGYIIYKELYYYSLDTINMFNQFTKRNSFATLNYHVHYKMLDHVLTYIIEGSQKINILEIGAGNGISTNNFITRLQKYGYDNDYDYNYIANEYYHSYKQDLMRILPEKNILIMPFEEVYKIPCMQAKFDVILLTAASAINEDNISSLKQLSHNNTIIVTIYPYIFQCLLEKYFDIVSVEKCTYLLGVFIVVVK
jgi:predicted O-methyltransferase YrrM